MIRASWPELSAACADQRGNIATETAFVMPFIVLLMIGVADFGLTARTRSTLDAAARAGLQVLLNNPANVTAAETMATDMAPEAVVAAELFCICIDGSDVECGGTCPDGAPRQIVTISVSQSYGLLLPWPGLSDPMPLAATARGRVQ